MLQHTALPLQHEPPPPFMQEEHWLRSMQEKHPPVWDGLAQEMGRTIKALKNHWTGTLLPSLIRGTWKKTPAHRREIRRAWRLHGRETRLKVMHELFGGRFSRDDFKNERNLMDICPGAWTDETDEDLQQNQEQIAVDNPRTGLYDVPWTHNEDALLDTLAVLQNRNWRKVADLIPGRTESQVKNRWQQLERQRRNPEIEGNDRTQDVPNLTDVRQEHNDGDDTPIDDLIPLINGDGTFNDAIFDGIDFLELDQPSEWQDVQDYDRNNVEVDQNQGNNDCSVRSL